MGGDLTSLESESEKNFVYQQIINRRSHGFIIFLVNIFLLVIFSEYSIKHKKVTIIIGLA